MSISTNDLKTGMALNLPEGLVTVVDFQHVKPGKGGAFVRTKLKNVRTGAVIDRTYRADEKPRGACRNAWLSHRLCRCRAVVRRDLTMSFRLGLRG